MPTGSEKARRSDGQRPDQVSALVRGIEVLRCFQAGARALSNGEIARRTGIPKPTVTRLAATLVSLGYLKQMPDTDKYAMSAGVLSLAQAFLSGLDVRASARPHMLELAESVDAAVYLAARDGLNMVLIEACRSQSTMIHSRVGVGSQLDLVTAAAGRAYLSALGTAERDTLIAQMRKAHGARWSRYSAGLERALRDAAARGYAMSAGEWHPDINTVAVALHPAEGELLALTCGGPAFAFPANYLRKSIAPRLLETAIAIAREIGGGVPVEAPARTPMRRAAGRTPTARDNAGP
ncbi:MAG: IclR family transcriptional regulator [Burkholderiales bacterium]|nr:IclR family transcriptional regulator [Burkholderiales bacterium]